MAAHPLHPVTEWFCRYDQDGRACRFVVLLRNGEFVVEDGPDDWTRPHALTGGKQSFDSYLQRPARWVREFPELAARIRMEVLAITGGNQPVKEPTVTVDSSQE